MDHTFDKKISKEDIQLLSEAGFVAINHGWHVKAQAIFQGLRVMRPKSELPSIGFCMNFMSQNKLSEALDLLEKEEHFFVANNSCYHLILRALVLRLMNRFQEALTLLSQPDADWQEYKNLVHVLSEDLKNNS